MNTYTESLRCIYGCSEKGAWIEFALSIFRKGKDLNNDYTNE